MPIMVIKKKSVQLKRLFNVAQDLKILNSHTLLTEMKINTFYRKMIWPCSSRAVDKKKKKKNSTFRDPFLEKYKIHSTLYKRKFSQKVISCYVKKRNLCQSQRNRGKKQGHSAISFHYFLSPLLCPLRKSHPCSDIQQ